MLSANYKPKRTAAVSRGFLATAQLSCLFYCMSKKLQQQCSRSYHMCCAAFQNAPKCTILKAKIQKFSGEGKPFPQTISPSVVTCNHSPRTPLALKTWRRHSKQRNRFLRAIWRHTFGRSIHATYSRRSSWQCVTALHSAAWSTGSAGILHECREIVAEHVLRVICAV